MSLLPVDRPASRRAGDRLGQRARRAGRARADRRAHVGPAARSARRPVGVHAHGGVHARRRRSPNGSAAALVDRRGRRARGSPGGSPPCGPRSGVAGRRRRCSGRGSPASTSSAPGSTRRSPARTAKHITATVEAVDAEVTGLETRPHQGDESPRRAPRNCSHRSGDRYAELESRRRPDRRAGRSLPFADRRARRRSPSRRSRSLGPPPSLPATSTRRPTGPRPEPCSTTTSAASTGSPRRFDEAEARYGAPLQRARRPARAARRVPRPRRRARDSPRTPLLDGGLPGGPRRPVVCAVRPRRRPTKLVERYQRAVRSAVGAEHSRSRRCRTDRRARSEP